MSMKKITARVIIGVLLIVCFICYFSWTKNLIEGGKTADYCGTLVYKHEQGYFVKRGSRTTLYFVVDFDKLGRREVNVNAVTYSSYEKNQRVCLSLKNEFVNPEDYHTPKAVAVIGLFFLVIASIVGIAFFWVAIYEIVQAAKFF